jgi:predicted enzyme related to lactoylglutathione lyase
MTSLILYAADPEAAAAFYRAIELGLEEQADRDGIPCLATDLGSVHFVIYPAEVLDRAGERGSAGSFCLGFDVESLDRAVEALAWLEAQILTGHEQTPWGCRIVAEDPDGRAVELSQCGHCPCS